MVDWQNAVSDVEPSNKACLATKDKSDKQRIAKRIAEVLLPWIPNGPPNKNADADSDSGSEKKIVTDSDTARD